MSASSRGAERATCIELMLTSARPSSCPSRPIVPGRSWWRVISILSSAAMSSRYAFRRTIRISPPASVPPTATSPPRPEPETVPRSVIAALNPPASAVLRSTTLIPRALARIAALTRLTRSVVLVSRTPRSAAAVTGPDSVRARSPASSIVSVPTPARANWARKRPSVSARGRYGPMVCSASALSSGALTAYLAGRPSRTSSTCSAISSATATWASTVDAPRCGVRTVFDASSSGEPAGGSFSNTSIPAPPRRLSRRAAASAGSSTMPPRATLSTNAPGFMRAIAFAPISPVVARVSGTWTVTASDRPSSASNSTSSTPRSAACSSVT